MSDAARAERLVWPGSTSAPKGASDPEHYAVLNGLYLLGLSAVTALAVRRERSGQEPIRGREVPLLGAATFALAQVLAKEKVSTWIREPFVEESAEHRPVRPEGHGLRYAIGELLTCTRCIGAWGALALVGLRTASPAGGRVASTVLASAGANNVLQTGFRLLAEKANRAVLESAGAPPP